MSGECVAVCLLTCTLDGGPSLTQLTSETVDDSDQEQHHSDSQSLSQKVYTCPVHHTNNSSSHSNTSTIRILLVL